MNNSLRIITSLVIPFSISIVSMQVRQVLMDTRTVELKNDTMNRDRLRFFQFTFT